MNRVIIYGRIDGPVEKKTVNDKPLVNFRIADAETSFRCSAWEKVAQQVAAAGAGAMVVAEGRQKTRQYKTSEGQPRTSTELTISAIEVVGPALREATWSEEDDSLPF